MPSVSASPSSGSSHGDEGLPNWRSNRDGVRDRVTSCSNRTPDTSQTGSDRPLSTDSSPAQSLLGGEPNALTAVGIIDAITKTGLPAPNALDTTAGVCPTTGCDQSITTDTLAIQSFGATGEAQKYAAARGLYQVSSVVVSIAPVVPEPERARYRARVHSLMDC